MDMDMAINGERRRGPARPGTRRRRASPQAPG